MSPFKTGLAAARDERFDSDVSIEEKRAEVEVREAEIVVN